MYLQRHRRPGPTGPKRLNRRWRRVPGHVESVTTDEVVRRLQEVGL